MSNVGNRAPLQWTDLHTFTEEGAEEAVRLQTAQGDMGPQYSISVGRVYNGKFTAFFRPNAPDANFEILEALYKDAKNYANEHKAKNGGKQPHNERAGARDKDWGNDDRGHGGGGRGKRARA